MNARESTSSEKRAESSSRGTPQKATVTNMRALGWKEGAFAACLDHPWIHASSNPFDYFMCRPDDWLECSECGAPMYIVREKSSLEAVSHD